MTESEDRPEYLEEDNFNGKEELQIQIYRYKFTDEFMNELHNFSKIHEFDCRKDFKEAWNIWIELNEIIINEEIKRLKNLGYEGEVKDKMFKSARYYFRKKNNVKKDPMIRKSYISINKIILDAIDEHIKINICKSEYKPSDGFLDFCKDKKDLIQEEVSRLCKIGITDTLEIKNKFKKTYKNRYFIITK
jgi:hypothetical protein